MAYPFAANFSAALQQAGGITTYPDAVNTAGTEQYFSVNVPVGAQYVACWSYGNERASVATQMNHSSVAPTFLSIEELIRAKKELTETEKTSPVEEQLDLSDYSATSPDDLADPSAITSNWFFVSLFSHTGAFCFLKIR